MRIELTDVVLRDGLQDEPVFVSTDNKIAIARSLQQAGVTRIEATSFVAPSRVPQMADAEDLTQRLPYDGTTEFTALALNSRGVERAARSGFDKITIAASVTADHSQANTGMSSERALERLAESVGNHHDVQFVAGVATAFVCPFDGPVAVDKLLATVGVFVNMGIKRINLADTLGTASSDQVLVSTGAVRAAYPDITVGLHLHNAGGQAFDTAIRAAKELGIAHFDSALAGFGGCPFAPGAHGNLATERLASEFHEHGFDTGTDLDVLQAAAAQVRQIVANAQPL